MNKEEDKSEDDDDLKPEENSEPVKKPLGSGATFVKAAAKPPAGKSRKQDLAEEDPEPGEIMIPVLEVEDVEDSSSQGVNHQYNVSVYVPGKAGT